MDQNTESDQISQEKFSRSEKILPGSDGWLSPSGTFYKADSTEHDESADWIIKNNFSELPRRRRKHVEKDLERWEESGLPPRQFLLGNGWILINGPVFRTDNALNYTTNQLTSLAEANISIVGAFDGSKEFSSRETLEWVRQAATSISDFIDKSEKVTVGQDEFWKEISNRGYSTLEDFKKDPFHTKFGDFGRVRFTDIRDVLTEGYQDEMVFDSGRETYMFRLLKLNSGEKICVEYVFHHHDGNAGNEESMNAYIVDDYLFKEKLGKFIGSGLVPRIKGDFEGSTSEIRMKGDYFKKLTEN